MALQCGQTFCDTTKKIDRYFFMQQTFCRLIIVFNINKRRRCCIASQHNSGGGFDDLRKYRKSDVLQKKADACCLEKLLSPILTSAHCQKIQMRLKHYFFQNMTTYNWARRAGLCDHCYIISCPYDIELHPNIVNTIKIENIENYNLEYLMHVKPHFMLAWKNPWIVISDYLHCTAKTVTIPVITQELCHLKEGDPLCHIHVLPLSEAYQNILKGI